MKKHVDVINHEKINTLEIPTGNPMIISFKNNLKISDALYLDKERAKPIVSSD